MTQSAVTILASANVGDVEKIARHLPETLRRNAAFGLARVGEHFVGEMKRSFFPRRSKDELHLQVRSGYMRRAIGWSLLNKNRVADMELRVYVAGVPYARIQEYGGEVRPTKARYLTIPLKEALTPSGVPKYPSAADLMRASGGSRGVRRGGAGRSRPKPLGVGERLYIVMKPDGKTFVLRVRPGFGSGIGFDRSTDEGELRALRHELRGLKRRRRERAKPGRLKFLYRLVTKVKIPPRLGFRRTWDADESQREAIMRDVVDRAVREAFLGP